MTNRVTIELSDSESKLLGRLSKAPNISRGSIIAEAWEYPRSSLCLNNREQIEHAKFLQYFTDAMVNLRKSVSRSRDANDNNPCRKKWVGVSKAESLVLNALASAKWWRSIESRMLEAGELNEYPIWERSVYFSTPAVLDLYLGRYLVTAEEIIGKTRDSGKNPKIYRHMWEGKNVDMIAHSRFI